MIGGTLILAPMLDKPIMALGYAVAISGILQLLIQLPQLWQQNCLFHPVLALKMKALGVF